MALQENSRQIGESFLRKNNMLKIYMGQNYFLNIYLFIFIYILNFYFIYFYLLFIYLFWLCRVLVVALGILAEAWGTS